MDMWGIHGVCGCMVRGAIGCPSAALGAYGHQALGNWTTLTLYLYYLPFYSAMLQGNALALMLTQVYGLIQITVIKLPHK